MLPACLLVLAAIVAGCKKADEIGEYTLTNPSPPAPTHRMLAAIVPAEQPADDEEEKSSKAGNDTAASSARAGSTTQPAAQAWFFKLVGPLAQIEKVAPAFDQFIGSIRIGKGDRPQWTLPAGWSEDLAAAAPQFGREAAIRIEQDGSQLELTISKLTMPAERREGWTIGNINRWREQLKLPAIARSELDEYTDGIKAGGTTAIKVDYRGVYSGGPMAGRLAANMAHGDADEAATNVPPQSKTTSSSEAGGPAPIDGPLPFDAEVPAEWKPARLKQFSVAAYEIAGDDGGRAAEVTISPLGPRAGDLKLNVDRWRKAIGLPVSTPAQLEEETKSIPVDGEKADYVHLIGPGDASAREATLGVIVRRPDAVWFFKLWGQADVVEREKLRFEEYVKSVRFK